jgi:hypothetical protein
MESSMEYGPEQLLAELLTYRRSPADSTSAFSEMKHDSDLCPSVQRRCDDILDAFQK